MSRRARLFSEFIDESEAGSRLTSAPTTVSTVTQDVLAKRRKTSGLNSRFDRMLETMNVTHRSPIKKSARTRAGSTSSASASSVPRTPIDDYNEFHRDGRLGTDFAIIKMDTASVIRNKTKKKLTGVFPWDQDSSSSDATEPPPPPPVPLPAWLASTFSTLTTKHPLRLLLPPRTNSEPTPSPRQIPTQIPEHDDSPFSFSASADPIDVSPPNEVAVEDSEDAEPSTQPTQMPCPRSAEPAFIYRPSLPEASFGAIAPFSMPGPGSVVSCSVVSDSLPSIHLPEPSPVQFSPPFAPLPQVHPPVPSPVQLIPSFTPLPQVHHPGHPYPNAHSAPSFVPQWHSTPAATKYTPKTAEEPPLLQENYTDHRPASDPPPIPNAYLDVFSTPGPGYQPVYFDSPTEDPSDSDPQSDPLQRGYELDSLDFKWKPFFQNAAIDGHVVCTPPNPPAAVSNSDDYDCGVQPSLQNAVCTPPNPPVVAPHPAMDSNSDDYYYETRVDPEGEDDRDGQLYASINMEPASKDRSPSPGRFSFAPPDVMSTTRRAHSEAQVTPERPAAPFFAPAPGIYISPLRDDEVPESAKPHQATDALDGSQTSNDPIEDWDDTVAD
ncbi:hypothetical protein DFH07DRAFT_1002111 [Mycena maculata]|uniref:Uncharacterized protein n=1 Tax=Mycena maculata TaxID=230809 RepID=A0AAD7HRL4_9AGAR|nr:hypothetical protein DFH07DRAFT_1002111 [Mycena maculata]